MYSGQQHIMKKHQSDSVQNQSPTTSTLVMTRFPSDEYKAIFEILVIGSFGLVAVLTGLLCISYFLLHNEQVIGRLFTCSTALLYLLATQGIWTRGQHRLASALLILFYFGSAVLIMLGQGIDTSFAQLMLAVTIVLTGVLLGARFALVAGAASILAMILLHISDTGFTPPGKPEPVNFGDILGFGALLGVISLISWLSSKRTAELFAQKKHANSILSKEKDALKIQVQERSKELKSKQLEEVEQLYKFAEVGQLSTMLLHDIANHLSVLNFDLATLKAQKHTKAVKHLEENIGYIEQAIEEARRQLKVKDDKKNFDVVACIEGSTKLPRFSAVYNAIQVTSSEKKITLYGEPLRLSHVVSILLRNAIESYGADTPRNKCRVNIIIEKTSSSIVITVEDQGKGISKEMQAQLFTPIHSSKKDGLGIGLFIAKKVIETHFDGTLRYEGNAKQTKFILEIPKTTI